jgi:hypothetical protein
MTNPTHPLEASLFRSYWGDGLLDILSGLGLVIVGLGFAFELPLFTALAPALLAPLWGPLRKKVVEPRSGYVEFSRRRQRHTNHGLLLTLALGVAALLLATGLFFGARNLKVLPLVQWVAALPAALLSVLALLTTLLTGTRRFAYYGLALLLTAAAAALLGWGPGAPILAGGLLVLASGITLLLRFLSASSGPLEETP